MRAWLLCLKEYFWSFHCFLQIFHQWQDFQFIVRAWALRRSWEFFFASFLSILVVGNLAICCTFSWWLKKHFLPVLNKLLFHCFHRRFHQSCHVKKNIFVKLNGYQNSHGTSKIFLTTLWDILGGHLEAWALVLWSNWSFNTPLMPIKCDCLLALFDRWLRSRTQLTKGDLTLILFTFSNSVLNLELFLRPYIYFPFRQVAILDVRIFSLKLYNWEAKNTPE